MDKGLQDLLKEWGLPQAVIKKFEENDITTKDHLRQMKIEDVEHLLTLGQKINFRGKLEAYNQLDNAPVVIEVVQPAPENVVENILENVPPENPNPLSDINLGGDGDDSGPSKRTPLRCSPRTSNVNRPDPTEVTPKNLFGTRSPTINFREFLESSLKGRSILSYYRLKNELNDENRRILSTLLITNEMENCLKIPNCKLDSLADLIVKEFPTEEKSNWYVPFAMEGKKRTCAGGKLYHFYHNERRTLREAGMLARRTQNPNQAIAGSEGELTSFNWVKKSSEPFETAISHWENCVEYRINLLKGDDQTPAKYMSNFICLKSNLGYRFLISDFKHLYPGKEDLLFNRWPDWRERIIKHHQKKAEEDINHQTLLSHLGLLDLPDDEQLLTICAFKLLTLSLLPKSIQGPKKAWKPASKSELLNFVFMQKSTFPDLQTAIEDKIKTFAEYGLTVQPCPAVINDNGNIQSYAIINKIFYRVESPIQALDVAIKACHALHADYPHEAKYSYLFLQKIIFDISTKFDGTCSSVRKLEKDLLRQAQGD
ncbi:unnamed protein product [Bemisia tabaci]|uniref:SAM domain-containing protein n=1 Tax=Bemisia tabaci TaxID=7038 RepID=A0A9N9ZZC1_BEMTA|nr:unnamed protein product [Bemisia tabaci]